MDVLGKLAVILTVTMIFLLPASGQDGDLKSGKHIGERKQFSVNIQFSGASGFTTTDEDGTTYTVGNWSKSENKVYPPRVPGNLPPVLLRNRGGGDCHDHQPRATQPDQVPDHHRGRCPAH